MARTPESPTSYYNQDSAFLLTVVDQQLAAEKPDTKSIIFQQAKLQDETPAYIVHIKPQGVDWPGTLENEGCGYVWRDSNGEDTEYGTLLITKTMGDTFLKSLDEKFPEASYRVE